MKHKITMIVFSTLFVNAISLNAQDWSVSLGDTFSLAKNLNFKIGRIPTSETYMASSQRLLRSTRYQRIPVGIYGWGGQLVISSEEYSILFDVTTDRNLPAKDAFEGFEIGTRMQYKFVENWSWGGNFTYDFANSKAFVATDIGYTIDDWDFKLAGYTIEDNYGGFLFAQYRPIDWLIFDFGIDYRSQHDSFEKFFGVKLLFEDVHTTFVIDYLEDNRNERNATIRARLRWEF